MGEGMLGQRVLQPGDVLTVLAGREFWRRRADNRNYYLLGELAQDKLPMQAEQPEKSDPVAVTSIASAPVEKQSSVTKQLNGVDRIISMLVWGSFAIMIALVAMGQIGLLQGLLLMFPPLLLSGTLTMEHVRRHLPLQLILSVGGGLMLAQATWESGLASAASDLLVLWLPANPFLALCVIYLGSICITEVITNNAAAALMIPLAMAVAESSGVSAIPFALAVAYGASASFLTPHGYQTNLMVMTPGQYRSADYLRFGLPLLVVYSVVVLVGLSLLYPLDS